MKGLLKFLSPMAPDQSGATAVFYDMNCITVICDAGGCTGNVCGFDEPRWSEHARPIFSAGLRDMDAILGRDDRLVAKLQKVVEKSDADFAVIIGTPVPAVIATDFKALKRMAEKRCGVPVVTCECTGTGLYDIGEERAYFELVKTFCKDQNNDSEKADDPVNQKDAGSGIVGVIGATPLNLSSVDADKKIRSHYISEGYNDVFCYGMGDGLDKLRRASEADLNVVVSPSGVKAAQYLEKHYGTPYVCEYPCLSDELKQELEDIRDSKVLVIHQQVAANEIRKSLLASNGNNEVDVASFFMMRKELAEPGDKKLDTESAFQELIESGGYDIIIGDELLERAVNRDSYGRWISCVHFAVSGKLEEGICGR